MASVFRSFGNVPILNQPKRPTGDELAAELAMEMIEGIKARRQEAEAREANADPPLEATDEDRERYTVLETLLKGRHRWVVLPLMLEHLPELVTPAPEVPPYESK